MLKNNILYAKVLKKQMLRKFQN